MSENMPPQRREVVVSGMKIIFTELLLFERVK